MRNILLSPHSDDQNLFASYIIQRTNPLIVICTDGTSHARKFGIPIEQRRQESRDAAKTLEAEVMFLGIAEEELNISTLIQASLAKGIYGKEWNFVFAPAKQGGNPHHDIVSDLGRCFRGACLYYSTYSKTELHTKGEMEIIPTPEEIVLKDKALDCFVSQIRINGHHFEAVKGKPEYLSFKQ